jgi:hypothetical protein
MYRNGIFPHEVRRALDGQIKEIENSLRTAGRRVSDPDVQSLLRLLYEKRYGSRREHAGYQRSSR